MTESLVRKVSVGLHPPSYSSRYSNPFTILLSNDKFSWHFRLRFIVNFSNSSIAWVWARDIESNSMGGIPVILICSSKTESLDEIVASVAAGGRQQQSHQVHHPPPMPKPVEAMPVQAQPQQQQQHQQQQEEEVGNFSNILWCIINGFDAYFLNM